MKIEIHLNYELTPFFQKGFKASPASFTCCIANGIPIIVIAKIRAKNKCVSEIIIPPVKIQIIFKAIYKQPEALCPSLTSLPKGTKAKPAILKN